MACVFPYSIKGRHKDLLTFKNNTMNQQSINSRLFEAQKQAIIKTEFEKHRNKGDKFCFIIHMGTSKQYYFYPVSNTKRYIDSLKAVTQLPSRTVSLF